jgi:hypothetical protein
VTNPLTISFIDIRSPSITQLDITSCITQTREDNSTYFTDCRGGVSSLHLDGHYFYGNTSVTINEQPCLDLEQNGVVLTCTLPELVHYDPTTLYDIMLTTDKGSVVVQDVVGFTALPSISRASSCAPTPLVNEDDELRCLGSEWVYLTGSQFLPDQLFNITITVTTIRETMSCTQSTFINTTAVACQLPVVPDQYVSFMEQSYVLLRLSYNSSWQSNLLPTIVYDFSGSPRITLVTGCPGHQPSSNPLSVIGCVGGDVLTVRGSNFSSNITLLAYPASFVCGSVVLLSNTELTCVLPQYSDDVLVSAVPYSLTITQPGPRGALFSNAITVEFDFNGSVPNTDGGSSSSSSHVVLAVVIPVIVLVVVVVALGVRRQWMLRKESVVGARFDV